MTSAPSSASRCPTRGPAQYAVMSRTRSPLKGNGDADATEGRAPAAGAGVMRNGGPGVVTPSPGVGTNVPRARKGAGEAVFAPSAVGAVGVGGGGGGPRAPAAGGS